MSAAPVTAEGIRARTRRELTEAIKAGAQRQVAETGAASLSLRAIARDLGMTSSALYRYYASRDDLLTDLVIDAYNDLGAAVEARLAEQVGAPPITQWIQACRAVREWALAHPHSYALIYGTPVPGYQAPRDTVAPASRVGLALANILAEAARAGEITAPVQVVSDSLRRDAAALAAELELDLPPAVVAGMVAAWSQLFGLVSFELFGQFENMITARAEFFDLAAESLARTAGIAVRTPWPAS